MDPAMMQQLMAAMGQGGGEEGGEGGGGGGMDMASLQAMLGGMGGGGGGADPAQQMAQKNQADNAAKNAGEQDGGVDGKSWKWEQTSKYGEVSCVASRTLCDRSLRKEPRTRLPRRQSEVIVRFPLETPATKKDVKVVFKAASLQVSVAGEELINGALSGTVQIDDCTWCLVEKGSELQVLLALAEDVKWPDLLAK